MLSWSLNLSFFLQGQHFASRSLENITQSLLSSVSQTNIGHRLGQVKVSKSFFKAISLTKTDILEDCLDCVLLWEGKLGHFVWHPEFDCYRVTLDWPVFELFLTFTKQLFFIWQFGLGICLFLSFFGDLLLHFLIFKILLSQDFCSFGSFLSFLSFSFHSFLLFFLLSSFIGWSKLFHHSIDGALEMPAAFLQGGSCSVDIVNPGHVTPAEYHVDLVLFEAFEFHDVWSKCL